MTPIGKAGKKMWTFSTDSGRKATVKAYTEHDARFRAIDLLDKRCIKRGGEPPIAWGLALIRTRELS